MKNKEG